MPRRSKRFVDEQIPRLKKYRDYREMLEKQKDIDAVIIATPDHMHAVDRSAAMTLGKHVYVQKPMCWSVHEARHLAKKAAANPKVVTQMGNQGHSHDDSAAAWSTYLGRRDRRRHAKCTSGPTGRSASGRRACRGRRGSTTIRTRSSRWDNSGVTHGSRAAMAATDYPVPDKLSWDLFLGVAPDVEYHPIYHPFNWRGWVDWGQGALGDMGAHLIDLPGVGARARIADGRSRPVDAVQRRHAIPNATTTYYEFPARKGMPAVKLTWYDGGLHAAAIPKSSADETLDASGGVLYVGKKGKLLQQRAACGRGCSRRRSTTPTARRRNAAPRAAPGARDELGQRDQGHGRSRARSPTPRT